MGALTEQLAKVDWKRAAGLSLRASRAWLASFLGFLLPSWSLCLFCFLGCLTAALASSSKLAEVFASRGPAYGAAVLAGEVVVLALLGVAFPAFHWGRSVRAGISGALRFVVTQTDFPLLRWGVSRVLGGLDQVAPGVLTKAVELDGRMVKAAYARVQEASDVPAFLRKLLLRTFAKVDLPAVLSLELARTGGKVELDELVNAVAQLVQHKAAELLRPRAVGLLLWGGLQLSLVGLFWWGLGHLLR